MSDSSLKVVPNRKDLDRPWPVRGEVMEWKGKCFFNPDLIKRNIGSTLSGVLHEKRPLLPLLDTETAEVIPNTKITIADVLDYSRPVYKGLIGEASVLIKLHSMPVNLDSESPWAELKTVNSELPLQLDVLREARAYEKLERLQGSVIPHCYGFYEYTRVGSRACLMQVLEFVEGIAPAQYCEDFDTRVCYTEMAAIYHTYFTTLIELHKAGVIQRQPISRHLRMLPPYDPVNIKMVIFDFTASDCIDFPTLPPGKRGPALAAPYWLRPDFIATLAFFYGETQAADQFMEWVSKPASRALVSRWMVFPEALTAEEREPTWYKPDPQSKKGSKL